MASSQAPRPRFWFAPLAARSTAAPPPDPTPPAPAPTPLAPRTPFIRPMFAPAKPVSPPSPPPPSSQPQPGSPPKTTTVLVSANSPPTTRPTTTPTPPAPAPAPTPAPAPLQPVAPRTPFLRPLFAQATVLPPEPQAAQPTPRPVPQTNIPIPTSEPQAPAPTPTPRTPFLRPMFTQPPQPTPIPTTQERQSSPVVTTLVPPRPLPPTATPLVPQSLLIPAATQPMRGTNSPPLPPPSKPISPPPPLSSQQRITSKENEPIKPTLIKNISPAPAPTLMVTKSPSSPPPPLTLPPAVQYKSNQDSFKPEAEQKNIPEKEINEHAINGYNPPKPSIAKTLFKMGKPTAEKGHHSQKKTPSSSWESDQEQRMRIITIAGENRGAVMEVSSPFRKPMTGEGNSNPMRTFTNSNVQGVNNSIMYNSSCTHNDPGVHLSLIRKPAAKETSMDHKTSSNA